MAAGAALPDDWDENKSAGANGGNSGGESDPSPQEFLPRRPISPEGWKQSPTDTYSDVSLPDPEECPSSKNSHLAKTNNNNQKESKFVLGDDLVELRKRVEKMKLHLVKARTQGDTSKIEELTNNISEEQARDPDYIYDTCLDKALIAEEAGQDDKATLYRHRALEARKNMPQYNLEGLWVGKYGPHGYEMINVTYVGDTLVATKVTGDKNVPKGEITFTANLNPSSSKNGPIGPIELSDEAARQWGTKHLPRFSGHGQVATEGFTNNQWIDGQLILVGEYFSFAWIPLGHQIFFGRPSAALTLKLLRESQMTEYGATDAKSPNLIAEMRAHAQKCYEESEIIADDMEIESEMIFVPENDAYFYQEGCFE